MSALRNNIESDPFLINAFNMAGHAAFLSFLNASAASHATSWSLSSSAFTKDGIALVSPIALSVFAASHLT